MRRRGRLHAAQQATSLETISVGRMPPHSAASWNRGFVVADIFGPEVGALTTSRKRRSSRSRHLMRRTFTLVRDRGVGARLLLTCSQAKPRPRFRP